MKARLLFRELRTALAVTLALAVLLCGFYPLLVWGIAQGVFPQQANGSRINRDDRLLGSSLIAQSFQGAAYFHPRPSSAGPDGYDATASGGSNLGPLSQKLMDQVRERVSAYRAENHLPSSIPVPADAVTASGSGLDPHISVRNAELQAGRVASARGMAAGEVARSIREHTEYPDLGFLGESRVNVLELNLALDALRDQSNGGR